jgi:hypothetical protein
MILYQYVIPFRKGKILKPCNNEYFVKQVLSAQRMIVVGIGKEIIFESQVVVCQN